MVVGSVLLQKAKFGLIVIKPILVAFLAIAQDNNGSLPDGE